jgi:hypothetical protein
MRPLRAARADDADYFRDRAVQEQVAAQRATSAAARERHDELAVMYRFRAFMLSKPEVEFEGDPDPEISVLQFA